MAASHRPDLIDINKFTADFSSSPSTLPRDIINVDEGNKLCPSFYRYEANPRSRPDSKGNIPKCCVYKPIKKLKAVATEIWSAKSMSKKWIHDTCMSRKDTLALLKSIESTEAFKKKKMEDSAEWKAAKAGIIYQYDHAKKELEDVMVNFYKNTNNLQWTDWGGRAGKGDGGNMVSWMTWVKSTAGVAIGSPAMVSSAGNFIHELLNQGKTVDSDCLMKYWYSRVSLTMVKYCAKYLAGDAKTYARLRREGSHHLGTSAWFRKWGAVPLIIKYI